MRIGDKVSQLGATLNIELTENAVHVVLHGRNADAALISNLLVGTTDGEQAADLSLAKRQVVSASPMIQCRGIGGRTCRHSPRISETHRNVHLFERRARTHEDCAATGSKLEQTMLADGADQDDLARERAGRERLRNGFRRGVDDQDVRRACGIRKDQSRVNVGNDPTTTAISS